MNHVERRDAQMAYISDESIFEEQAVCRKKLQKLNFMDRSDFDGLGEAAILRWAGTFLPIITV